MLVTTGCVHVQSYPVSDRASAGPLPSGAIPYLLPKTDFMVTAVYTLDCNDPENPKSSQNSEVTLKSQVTVVPVSMPDDREHYYIQANDLRGWLKDSKITVTTNANQTLASVNGTITDQTGATVGNAITALASVGYTDLPGLSEVIISGQKRQKKPGKRCVDYIRAEQNDALLSLDGVHALKAEIGDLEDKRDAAIDALYNQQGKRSRKSGDASTRKPEDIRAYYDSKIAVLNTRISKITANYLTMKVSYLWDPMPPSQEDIDRIYGPGATPPAFQIFTLAVNDFAKQAVEHRWMRYHDDTDCKAEAKEKLSNYHGDDREDFFNSSLESCLEQYDLPFSGDVDVNVELSFQPWSRLVVMDKPSSTEGLGGFVVRNPALATLRICKRSCPAVNHDYDVTDVLAQQDNIAVGQFGRRMVIPFKNRPFETSGLTLALAPDGTVTSVGPTFTSTVPAALTSLSGGLNTVGTVQTAQNTATAAANSAKVAQATYADTVNKAVADCLTQRKAVIDAGGEALACQ